MPMYDYRCPNGHEFEEMNSVAQREHAECFSCGKIADKVILTAARIDPKMGLDPSFPGMYAKWRKDATARARGKDMTAANKTVEDEGIDRKAHADRTAYGEKKIIVS